METLDELLGSLRECLAALPDKRRGANKRYAMTDAGLAAFSVFFMQSPSFLAHQRHLEQGQGRSNCRTLLGMTAIPCDNHIRALLDPVEPAHLHRPFAAALAALERADALAAFRRLGGPGGGHVLIALDGTEYFRSTKLSCRHCSTRARAGGKSEFFHAMLAPALVAPGHTRVLPLPPEFIVPQDGHAKQDCESRAAQRWLAAHAARYARLAPIYLGDDLYSRQPLCQAVRTAGGHFLFVCKPESHPTLQEYVTGAEALGELDDHVERVKRGRERFTYRYRWLGDVPLRDGDDALMVNWLSIEIVNAAGKLTYRNSFVTDLPVERANVAALAACGRARWKIENESFNTLKTKGYNLEHNFGHGKDHLCAVLTSLNLLAFAFHTVCELVDELWRRAAHAQGRRSRFFEALRSLTVFMVFPDWDDLIATLAFARAPP